MFAFFFGIPFRIIFVVCLRFFMWLLDVSRVEYPGIASRILSCPRNKKVNFEWNCFLFETKIEDIIF